MNERQLRRMKKHPFQPFLAQALVEVEVAVLVVAQNGMAEVSEVDADLVGAAGEKLRLEQAVIGAALHQAKDGLGGLPFLGDRHALVALASHPLREREAHALQRV